MGHMMIVAGFFGYFMSMRPERIKKPPGDLNPAPG
jgi:hypothetical protein